MQIQTVTQALDTPVGGDILAFSGLVTTIGDHKTFNKGGSGSSGSLQILQVQDPDTQNTVKVKVWGHAALSPRFRGQIVFFTSTKGEKGGMHGIRMKEDEYKGNITKEIHCTEKAEISVADSQTSASQAQPEPKDRTQTQSQPQQPQQPQQTTSRQPSKPKNKDEELKLSVLATRRALGQAANALKLCFDAAVNVGEHVKAKHGVELSTNELEKIAVHLSIHLEKSALVFGMPSGDLAPYMPKPKIKRTPEHEEKLSRLSKFFIGDSLQMLDEWLRAEKVVQEGESSEDLNEEACDRLLSMGINLMQKVGEFADRKQATAQ